MVSIKQTRFKSSIISHPVQTGNNSVAYTIIHNKGMPPSRVEVYRNPSNLPSRVVLPDFNQSSSSDSFFWNQGASSNNLNESLVRVYRVDSVTVSLQIVLFFDE